MCNFLMLVILQELVQKPLRLLFLFSGSSLFFFKQLRLQGAKSRGSLRLPSTGKNTYFSSWSLASSVWRFSGEGSFTPRIRSRSGNILKTNIILYYYYYIYTKISGRPIFFAPLSIFFAVLFDHCFF